MRYFFPTESDVRYSDTVGMEVETLAAARALAAKEVAHILCDDAPKFWGSKPWSMTVTDGAGLVFFVIEVHGLDSPAADGRS